MKVKYLFNDGHLKYEGIYNVFSIQEWNNKEKKIYIADHDASGDFYISPYPFDAFDIIDTRISKFWNFGIDKFGQITLGIPEIFSINNFWEKYYDDDIEINDIIDLYYRIGKRELFNLEV